MSPSLTSAPQLCCSPCQHPSPHSPSSICGAKAPQTTRPHCSRLGDTRKHTSSSHPLARTPFSQQQMEFRRLRESGRSLLSSPWSPERLVGTDYSPRGSPSPAEQEQKVVAALSLHPSPLRATHSVPATTTTTRPHLPVARVWELTGCGGNWPNSSLKPP